MTRCSAIRWRIPEFLNGNLPADLMEEVREHLDLCEDCAVALAHPARVDAVALSEEPQLSPDFTQRLLSSLPSSFTGEKLAAFVGVGFIASGIFGVAIWACIRWLLGTSQDAAQTAATTGGADFINSVISSPAAQYLGLGLLAVILCFAVIVIVDRPWAADPTTEKQA